MIDWSFETLHLTIDQKHMSWTLTDQWCKTLDRNTQGLTLDRTTVLDPWPNSCLDPWQKHSSLDPWPNHSPWPLTELMSWPLTETLKSWPLNEPQFLTLDRTHVLTLDLTLMSWPLTEPRSLTLDRTLMSWPLTKLWPVTIDRPLVFDGAPRGP